MSTWDEVDDRILRWLLAQDSSPEWRGISGSLPNQPEPVPRFGEDLDSRQVAESLRRLVGYGFVDGTREATFSDVTWTDLRVTARGLIVLGEWPDMDRVAGAHGLVFLLSELAGEASDEDDQRSLRKAAGTVQRLGEDIVASTMESVGEGLS
jgi:hypothetical protein